MPSEKQALSWMQVSMATQRAATTTTHRPTEKLSEDTYQSLYSPRPTKREGREGKGQTAAQMHDLVFKIAQPPRTSMGHLKLGKNLYVE